MKLSKKVISLLESFANINKNILIQPGNKIRTMSPTKSVLAESIVDVEFEDKLCIYDLDKFLSLYKCVEHPELTVIGNHSVLIHNDEDTIEYRLSDEQMVLSPPDKELKLPSTEVELELTKYQLNKCVKVAKALSVDYLAVVGDGTNIYLKVLDKKNTGADSYKTVVGETENTFTFFVKLENLKLIDGSYDVFISKKNLAKFVSQRDNIFYFVALEPDSEWSELENNFASETTEVEEEVEEVKEEPTYTPPSSLANRKRETRNLYDEETGNYITIPTSQVEEWEEEYGERLSPSELLSLWKQSNSSTQTQKGSEEITEEELLAMVE